MSEGVATSRLGDPAIDRTIVTVYLPCMSLLTTSNAKTQKGETKGYMTFILHLAPNVVSGYNTCPMASAGCIAGCLNTAGRGIYQNIQNARIRKTEMFFENREQFMTILVGDIASAIATAERKNLVPVFRLNGTSDIRWENIPVLGHANVMEVFPNVMFYDYTKMFNRRNLPPNYNLTFSRSENNEHLIPAAFGAGMNVAVVFDKIPETWNGYNVIDGTEDDCRFLDPKNVIVGLTAKGKARKDHSGFVVK